MMIPSAENTACPQHEVMKNKKRVKAGRKGGIMGTGAAKTRSVEHYQRMALLSAEARRAKRGDK
jgi:hypothetical protein